MNLLRHTLATLAYRSHKALAGVPPDFGQFHAGADTRTPGEILAHMGDLLDWALALAEGKKTWHDSTPRTWEEDTARFFHALDALDQRLASEAPLACSAEKLFQGPIADALTHVGQINILRRLAGSPVLGENYFRANIAVGRVGPDQPAPVKQFQ